MPGPLEEVKTFHVKEAVENRKHSHSRIAVQKNIQMRKKKKKRKKNYRKLVKATYMSVPVIDCLCF